MANLLGYNKNKIMKRGKIYIEKNGSEQEIQHFLNNKPEKLPIDYVNYIIENHSVDGDLPVNPYYFSLWAVNEVLETNTDYQLDEYLPNYFGIGSQGGGELIAISLIDFKIYCIPFMPMNEEDRILCFESFNEFKENMGFAPDED